MDDSLDCPSRRGVLRSLAAVGVSTIAAGVLVACGSSDGTVGAGSAGGGTGSATGPGGTGTGSDGTGTGGTGTGGTGTDGAGSDGTGTDGTEATGTDGAAGSDGTPTDGAGDGSSPTATDGGGSTSEASVPLSQVPVGEAVVVDALGTRLVLAQPRAGEVVAFSATCTHAGTQVQAAGGLELLCPAHGSRFDAGDGAAVVNGPAAEPLPAYQARVEGDLVVLSV